MLKRPAAWISVVLMVAAVAALLAFGARRFTLAPRETKPNVASPAADAPSVEVRPLPPRLGRGDQSPEGTGGPSNRGGPWYVVCAHHPGGYCSDPYDNFDVAMARAETHRTQTHHLGVGVSTACLF